MVRFFLLIILISFSYHNGIERSRPYEFIGYASSLFFLVVLIFVDVKNRMKYFSFNSRSILILFFAIVLTLSSLITGEYFNGIISVYQIIFLYVLGNYLYYSLGYEKAVSLVASVILSSGLFFALTGIVSDYTGSWDLFLFKYDYLSLYEGRMTGLLGSANYFGTYMYVALICAFYVKFRSPLIKVIIMIILTYCIVSSGSRGVLFSAALSVFFVYLYQNFGRKGIVFFLSSLICLMWFIDLESLIVNYISRDPELYFKHGADPRVGFWLKSFSYYKEFSLFQKLLGYGHVSYFNLLGGSTHSGWLTLLMGKGIISLILLIQIFRLGILNSLSAPRNIALFILTFGVLKNLTNADFPAMTFLGIVVLLLVTISLHENSLPTQ